VLLDGLALDLWQVGRLAHAIPRLLDARFGGLPVRAAGMLLGELGDEGFVPSHELVSRFFGRFTSGRLTLPDEQVGPWLAGGEIRGVTPPGDLTGRVALLEDSRGRFLGRGRIAGGRLRNLLPAGF
jgi:NOL1/NOP2/fmu family ribosome biogenesis protein